MNNPNHENTALIKNLQVSNARYRLTATLLTHLPIVLLCSVVLFSYLTSVKFTVLQLILTAIAFIVLIPTSASLINKTAHLYIYLKDHS